MPKTIKYTGSQSRWHELAVTGKQSVWMSGQQEERSDAEALQLLGTGLFAEVLSLSALPLQSLVSGAGDGTFAIAADSMGDRCTGIISVGAGAAVRVNGVVTVTAPGHGLGTGMLTDFNNATDPTFNVRDAPVTWVDSSTFRFPAPGPDGTAVAIANRQLLARNSYTLSDNGFWVWFNAKIGGSGTLLKNAAVSSRTTAEIVAGLATEVVPYGPEWCVLQPGLYNDFNTQPNYQTYTADQCIAELSSGLATLRAVGIKVAFMMPVALGTVGGATTKAAVLQKYMAVMKWMRAQAAKLSGVAFADSWTPSVDPLNVAPGTARAGYLASDGFHPAPRWAEAAAQALTDAIGSLVARTQQFTSGSGDNYDADSTNGNVWPIGPWTASGGTVNAATGGGSASGAIAAGLQAQSVLAASGTAVWSMPARADGRGYDVQCVFTSASASDWVRFYGSSTINASRLIPGRKYIPKLWISIAGLNGTNAANLKGINALIFMAGGSAPSCSLMSLTADTPARYVQSDFSLPLVGQPIVIPTDGISSFDYRVQVMAAAAGGPATIRCGLMSWDLVP